MHPAQPQSTYKPCVRPTRSQHISHASSPTAASVLDFMVLVAECSGGLSGCILTLAFHPGQPGTSGASEQGTAGHAPFTLPWPRLLPGTWVQSSNSCVDKSAASLPSPDGVHLSSQAFELALSLSIITHGLAIYCY